MTLRFYHSPGARSLATCIALIAAGTDFDPCCVSIAAGAHREPDYLEINRRGRVPSLEVDGTVITENIAILSSLGHRFPASRLLPLTDLRELARCEELLAFYAVSVHIACAQYWRPERFSDVPNLYMGIKKGARQRVLRYFDEIELLLAGRDWAVGSEFTVGDTYALIFYRWGRRIRLDVAPIATGRDRRRACLNHPRCHTPSQPKG